MLVLTKLYIPYFGHFKVHEICLKIVEGYLEFDLDHKALKVSFYDHKLKVVNMVYVCVMNAHACSFGNLRGTCVKWKQVLESLDFGD